MNNKNYKALVWTSLGIGILQFLFFIEEKSVKNLMLSLIIASLYTFFIGIGNGMINDYLNKKIPWVESTKKRAVVSIISILFGNIILVFFCNYINFVVIQKDATSAEFFAGKYNFSNWFMINLALLISSFLHAKSFMIELKKATKKEVVEQKLIANSANAQFESLKNQLDPHFLFNSLNVLNSLIEENPVQAQKFTVSMSKIYRYVLEQKDKELVTLEEEVQFAKTYCELLKTRFEDSVNFEFQIDENTLSHFVIPLSLQLLLENGIKHNLATSSRPLVIKIYTENNILCVENNLQEREKLQESSGIGLTNIVARYSLLTQRNVLIEKAENYFKVKLPILSVKQNLNNEEDIQNSNDYQLAKKRVKELKKFYNSVISYGVIIPFLIFINLMSSPDDLWFWWPMVGWGIAIVLKALRLFVIGSNWEEKEMQKILNKKE